MLAAARAHIASSTPFSAIATISEDDPLPRIKLALLDLSNMDPIRQAGVFQPQPDPFEGLVISYVRSAAASVVSLVPMMKNITIHSCEDDLTALVREVLRPHFQFLGWSLADQSKGGFTAKENPGERDVLLQKNSTTLAVIEAVVCHRPVTHEWTRLGLTSHFQKLLAYSTCSLFFHLTYAYIDSLAEIMDHLRRVAKEEAPSGFTFVCQEDIPSRLSTHGVCCALQGGFGRSQSRISRLEYGPASSEAGREDRRT